MLMHHLSLEPRNGGWPVSISQSVTPSEYRSERMSTPSPANCSGLANSGVPAKTPGVEIVASEWDSATAFASPRSIIFPPGLRAKTEAALTHRQDSAH